MPSPGLTPESQGLRQASHRNVPFTWRVNDSGASRSAGGIGISVVGTTESQISSILDCCEMFSREIRVNK